MAAPLAGCAIFQKPWPEEGRGQFAEQFESSDNRARDLEARLVDLEARGANVHAAGDLDEAKLLLARVKREIEADLVLDAEDNMAALDRIVARMDARLGKARRR